MAGMLDDPKDNGKFTVARQMADFTERFRPRYRDEAYDFEMALSFLVQSIYQEAQAPVMKMLSDAAAVSMSMSSPFVVSPKETAKQAD